MRPDLSARSAPTRSASANGAVRAGAAAATKRTTRLRGMGWFPLSKLWLLQVPGHCRPRRSGCQRHRLEEHGGVVVSRLELLGVGGDSFDQPFERSGQMLAFVSRQVVEDLAH